MLVLALRALLLFVFVFGATRIMGKREIGQLQPYEFVIAIMMADLASVPVSNTGIPLLHGIVPILVLMCVHLLISVLSLKSPVLRRLLSGRPVLLIRDGRIQGNEMKRLRYNFSDLMEELRASGVACVADVALAVVETSGKVSVLPKSSKRPLQTSDIGLHVPPDPFVFQLIVDGRLQSQSLHESGFTEQWLRQRLQGSGFSRWDQVFFASVDENGGFFIQGYGEAKP
ncbi:MAG: DUF421 domain-containing protein [Eubacteriales bacterium]|nr:DUF421 domain-containing protein [Eubacteriales bacterium]